jgi:hypothetical protein
MWRSWRRRSSAAAGAGMFSCVVDTDPRFHLEALRWFAALTEVAGVEPSALVVHAVGGSNSDALEYLQLCGVAVRSISSFDERSPHCNKIAGALSLAQSGVDGLAVLTDADVAICRDARLLRIPQASVGSKLVDRPHPPLELLRKVFQHAGVPLPAVVSLYPNSWQSTVAGNGNGGLYLIPGAVLSRVAGAWAKWACWLLDRPALLERYTTYVDQVAMALALATEHIDATRLGVEWNLPTHIPELIPPDADAPAVLHYHKRVEPTGLLSMTGVAAVDEMIATVNTAIAKVWQASFPNQTFWEWRYRTDPTLASGIESRGKPLEEKRRLLAAIAAEIQPSSVLDVGCGDGAATSDLAFERYVGIDLSAEAVRIAQRGRPDGEFRVGTLDENARADLTICLDVLIHQPDTTAYEVLVGRLLRSAHRALIVSGYEEPPSAGSQMVYFHEALSATLRRLAPTAKLTRLREGHEITTFLVLR